MVTKQLIENLKGKNLDDLREISKKLNELIEIRKSEVAWSNKSQLKIGSIVTVPHGKLKGKELRVEKINIKKAVLSILNENSTVKWNVPLSMIEIK
jgi:transcription antitermination factor NusG